MRIGPHELLEAVRGRTVLLTGPADPDGDSVGACLALQRGLRACGVDAEVAGVPGWRYTRLPGAAAMIPDDLLAEHYGAVVVVDGDCHRMAPEAGRRFAAAEVRAIVDHHRSTDEADYTHAWVEPTATSTCAMAAEALHAWGVVVDRELAALIYAGTVFDTGGFRHGNTRPDTHRLAAALLDTGFDHVGVSTPILAERRLEGLRATARVWERADVLLGGQVAIGVASIELLADLDVEPGDLEGVVDGLVNLLGVEVGALVIERGHLLSKVSLRSRGRVDVAALAQRISRRGGGHPRAAGATVEAPVDEVRARLLAALAAALKAS